MLALCERTASTLKLGSQRTVGAGRRGGRPGALAADRQPAARGSGARAAASWRRRAARPVRSRPPRRWPGSTSGLRRRFAQLPGGDPVAKAARDTAAAYRALARAAQPRQRERLGGRARRRAQRRGAPRPSRGRRLARSSSRRPWRRCRAPACRCRWSRAPAGAARPSGGGLIVGLERVAQVLQRRDAVVLDVGLDGVDELVGGLAGVAVGPLEVLQLVHAVLCLVDRLVDRVGDLGARGPSSARSGAPSRRPGRSCWRRPRSPPSTGASSATAGDDPPRARARSAARPQSDSCGAG